MNWDDETVDPLHKNVKVHHTRVGGGPKGKAQVITFIFLNIAVVAAFILTLTFNICTMNNRIRMSFGVAVTLLGLLLIALLPPLAEPTPLNFFIAAVGGCMVVGTLSSVLFRWIMTLFHGFMPFALLPHLAKKPKKLSEVKRHLRTGDLVFCSESRKRSSQIIRFFTYSPYSHVGLIVRDPTPNTRKKWGLPPVEKWTGEGKEVYVFEAVPPKVCLRPIEYWINLESSEYPDQILAVRQLDLRHIPITKEEEQKLRAVENVREIEKTIDQIEKAKSSTKRVSRNDVSGDDVLISKSIIGLTHEEITSRLEEWMIECFEKKYETTDSELALSAFQLNAQSTIDEVFCSELVAESYKRAGLLETERLSNNFAPINFSALDLTGALELSPGVRLSSAEWRIVSDKRPNPRQLFCQKFCLPCCAEPLDSDTKEVGGDGEDDEFVLERGKSTLTIKAMAQKRFSDDGQSEIDLMQAAINEERLRSLK
eukprot:g1619.t1